MNSYNEPDTDNELDCDLCPECGEHSEFDNRIGESCCGCRPYDLDPDTDMER
jgi:hypothetical protein